MGKSGGPIIPLLCLLKCIRKCSHARQGQIAVPRCSILPHSADERKDSALYPACNPIHTHSHSHTFTCNLAEELWWLKASYLFYFKHVDSESFDLAFRDADAAAVTALLAFVGIQAS